jgi:hypothetical protein
VALRPTLKCDPPLVKHIRLAVEIEVESLEQQAGIDLQAGHRPLDNMTVDQRDGGVST